jgi:hypothetical protein
MAKTPSAGGTAGGTSGGSGAGSSPDWGGILEAMISAGAAVASANWSSAESYARAEFEKLAVTGKQIINGMSDGSINPQVGQILLDAQKSQSQAIIASHHIMNLVQAQAVVNAATGVLTTALNTAIGAIKFA